jgi:2-polyprenyl-3-methyl-5-hydroxy-6-metoxy-1,4-benzoquinol methylase
MQCRICGNEKGNQSYAAEEMMFGYKDLFHYFQCSRCNCLQIKDFPSDMSKYYPDNYYSYQPIPRKNKIIKFLISLRDSYALFNRGFIGKLLYTKYPSPQLKSLSFLSLSKSARILDVGCGVGELVYSLCQLGFKKLVGIDPFNTEDIQYENGLRIERNGIHAVSGEWDLIMFHHSFEHIADAINTMQTVAALLQPNGHCVIRAPTVSSHAWEHYKVKWVQLDAPRHFYLHSVESIAILANKTGLVLYKIIYDSTAFQFWESEQYKNNIPLYDKRSYQVNQKDSIFSRRQIAAFARQAKELNRNEQGDQAIFYLKKAEI